MTVHVNWREDAGAILPRLTAAVLPGSYLAIMHPASDLDPVLLETAQRWNQLAAQPVRLRSRADMTGFLAGLELVEPGLVTVPEWRPEADERQLAEAIPLYAVVAKKP
jgi:S-adenosyl methyltransferase